MKRKSNKLTWLRLDIHRAARSEENPEKKSRYWRWYKTAQESETEFDEMLLAAEMHGIRNPAFPDDFIGWLDDDFADRPQLLGYEGKQRKEEKKDEEDNKDKDSEDNKSS